MKYLTAALVLSLVVLGIVYYPRIPRENPRSHASDGTAPVHAEIVTGKAGSVTQVVTSTSITAATDNFYVASISTKPYRTASSVTGLGLTWTKAAGQCAGRNQTGVEIWYAQGSPTQNGNVTARFTSAPSNSVIAVSRITGADSVSGRGSTLGFNTNGVNGTCSGGVDSKTYSSNLVSRSNTSLVYSAVAIRLYTHTPGAGFTEYTELAQGYGGEIAGLAVTGKNTASTSTTVNGTLSSNADWAVATLEIVGGAAGTEPTPTPTDPIAPPPTDPVTPPAEPTPTPTPTSGSCVRPYADNSPWNTKIPPNPTYHPKSAEFIAEVVRDSRYTTGMKLTSNPSRYTYPVYEVTNSTPKKTVYYSGTYSNVYDNGDKLERTRRSSVSIPIPAGAAQSAGDDAQIIIINKDTGDEWGFYEARIRADGNWDATNGYHYNTNWSGVPPAGFGSRGAGVTYLAGLIRPCEIAQGKIDHAIAFAYPYPCSKESCVKWGWPAFVSPPATKTDGKSTQQYDHPEGARMHLVATDAEIDTWCKTDNACKVIGRALRDYGMITIDQSGSAKIYAEYEGTANWNGIVSLNTPGPLPLSRFKMINF